MKLAARPSVLTYTGSMKRALGSLFALLWLVLAGAAMAQPAFPERGTAPVLDEANIIDAPMEAQLTALLDEFEETNQRQFVIVTLPSLQGYEISDYGYQLGPVLGTWRCRER